MHELYLRFPTARRKLCWGGGGGRKSLWCHVSILSQNCHRITKKITVPYFLYERDSVMRLPLQKDLSFSEPQCLFWKLTFKLSGNSASFCFAFRSCFVSSGSVIGSFTSSLLSRKEQVTWVTVLLKWLPSLPPVQDTQKRVGQASYAPAHSCQSPK